MYYTGQPNQYTNYYGQAQQQQWMELQPIMVPLAPAVAFPIATAIPQPLFVPSSPPHQVAYVIASSPPSSPPSSPIRSEPTAPANEDELKRCKLCGQYYHNVRSKCTFHPGKYQNVRVARPRDPEKAKGNLGISQPTNSHI